MKKLFLIIFGALLAGCGTKTSEIIPSGNDTYFISGHGYAQKAPEAMTGLYKEANTYCQNMGKKFIPVSTDSQNFDLYSSSVNMHFRCLPEGDTELARPRLQKTPDTTIEVHAPR